LAETIAFHGGVILACVIVLNILDGVRTWKRSSIKAKAKISGIRQEFRSGSLKCEFSRLIANMFNRYSLIPLTIFYSSLTKLFLLFLLSIWRPTPPEIRPSAYSWNGTLYDHFFVSRALEILDEDKLDREWVARNVLGGMAAGFGLRGAYLNISRKPD
jgi:lipid intermediate transporter